MPVVYNSSIDKITTYLRENFSPSPPDFTIMSYYHTAEYTKLPVYEK